MGYGSIEYLIYLIHIGWPRHSVNTGATESGLIEIVDGFIRGKAGSAHIGRCLDIEDIEQEVEIDADGNIVTKPQEPSGAQPTTNKANSEATDPKKDAQPQYEDVTF